MFEHLKRNPEIVYHFTMKNKIASVKNDRQLKKFKDKYVFVCESYEACIDVIKSTILTPDARYVGLDGISRPYKNKNMTDYTILKLKTRHADTMKWFKSTSANNPIVDSVTIAYKGNLPIEVLEEIEIKI